MIEDHLHLFTLVTEKMPEDRRLNLCLIASKIPILAYYNSEDGIETFDFSDFDDVSDLSGDWFILDEKKELVLLKRGWYSHEERDGTEMITPTSMVTAWLDLSKLTTKEKAEQAIEDAFDYFDNHLDGWENGPGYPERKPKTDELKSNL